MLQLGGNPKGIFAPTKGNPRGIFAPTRGNPRGIFAPTRGNPRGISVILRTGKDTDTCLIPKVTKQKCYLSIPLSIYF